MGQKAISRCPACGETLKIMLLKCPACQIEINGEFSPCKFCQLEPVELELLDAFIKNRGNMRQMEKELFLSYPTIRGRLDKLARTLGLNEKPIKSKVEQRQEILELVSQGDVSTEKAMELLKDL